MKYLIISILLVSCYTAKKAERQINKAQIYHPEVVAAKSALWYPCVPLSITTDSTAYKEWLKKIDSLNGIIPIRDTIIDTLWLDKVCPERKVLIKYKELIRVMPTLHDTIMVENTAYKVIADDLKAENKKVMGRYAGALKFAISLLIALIVSIILNFRKR